MCAGCHREDPDAVHRSAETMKQMHEYGQRLAMERFGWTVAEFMERLGKNYLDE